MNYIQVIFLSIVEGVTEFLPVSSTGHLILASRLLHIPQTEFVKSFEIIIQLGAILAVVFLYARSLLKDIQIWRNVIISFIPTGFLGLVFYRLVKTYLIGNLSMVIISLFLGGVAILIFNPILTKNSKNNLNLKTLSITNLLTIGAVQSLSMIPGISRALATIFAGLSVGLDKHSAVEFSFLLAIPTMLAATTFDLIKTRFLFSANEYLLLLTGLIGSFISALFTIKLLLNFTKHHSFNLFAYYRIILAFFFWLIFCNKQ